MPSDLEKKIEGFSEEIFASLGLATLSEESKADIFARVQQQLHKVITAVLKPLLSSAEVGQVKQAIDQEDYHTLDAILMQYPQYKEALEKKIDEEFQNLKLTIAEEQTHGRNPTTGA